MTAPKFLIPQNNGQPRPLVSVVMPTYNRANLLRESAKMILNQTLVDSELIISDDQSTDNTAQVVHELATSDSRVSYHRTTIKGGVAVALNEAIMLSRGYYIQVCHDHDIYFATMLEKLAGVLDRHPSIVFAHPGRQGCDHLGNALPQAYFVCGYPEITEGKKWKQKMLKRLASPVTALSMIRRTALEAVGLFDPDFGVSTDVEMWMRLCDLGDVGYVNELLLFVRGREPGHPYAGVNWEIVDQVIRAHRKHLRLSYHGWPYFYWKCRREMQIDLSLLIDYLNSFRHRRWMDVRLGRSYLRKHGVILSKICGWIL
jgi:glycosyltransferase involved in cell wall biosynthesis